VRLKDQGVSHEEMAILYRANYRSEDFEEAFTDASIPFQVRGGAFLTRRGSQQLLRGLRRRSSTAVAEEVLAAAQRAGYDEDPPDGLGEQELTRQNDLARLVKLAANFDDGARTVEDFLADLQARFGSDGDGRGVNLLTYHRAKGLEFDAVFLPRLEEGELPFKRAKSDAAVDEERRLLYVGITRARRHLMLSWSTGPRQQPSRFLGELGLVFGAEPGPKAASKEGAAKLEGDERELFDALKTWRKERAGKDSVPAYVVFHDAVLVDIVKRRPAKLRDLATIPGIGSAKLERYGPDVLTVLQTN
jgi:DNA helicase-2/ATP-dependent DNA helicase PcrA